MPNASGGSGFPGFLILFIVLLRLGVTPGHQRPVA